MSTTENALTESNLPKVGKLEITEEHAREVGLPSPAAVNYMMSIANMLFASALITPDMEPPKAEMQAARDAGWTQEQIQAWREKTIKANAMAKMLIGREMKIEAMASLQDIDIVKGRIFIRYPQLMAQIEAKGYQVIWEERTHTRAALRLQKGAYDELFEFTIDDAKRAGLTGGKQEHDQYALRPRVMLSSRVISEAYRMTGGRANVYTPEEKQEVLQRSTTDEPDDADRTRGEQLRPEGQFTVKPKENPKPETPQDKPADKVVDISRPNGATTPDEPILVGRDPLIAKLQQRNAEDAAKAKGSNKKTETKPEEKKPEPEKAEGKVVFEIHTVPPDAKPIHVSGEDGSNRSAAVLRAQALANQTGIRHDVVENAGGERVTKDQCDPPAHVQRMNRVPPPADPTPVTGQGQGTAAASAPEPAKASSVKSRVAEVVRRVVAAPEAKGTPEKTVQARVATFLVGYLGVKGPRELPDPTNEAVYADALSDLESVSVQDVNVLLAEPAECGRRMAADEVGFRDLWKETQWPANVCALARRMARERGNSAGDLQTHVRTLELDFGPIEDTESYLRLALRTRNAGKFFKTIRSHGLSMALVLKQLEERGAGKRVEEADPKVIEVAMEEFLNSTKQAAKPASATAKKQEATPAPPPKQEEETGGLFGDDE